jgi:hypothetical protein
MISIRNSVSAFHSLLTEGLALSDRSLLMILYQKCPICQSNNWIGLERQHIQSSLSITLKYTQLKLWRKLKIDYEMEESSPIFPSNSFTFASSWKILSSVTFL